MKTDISIKQKTTSFYFDEASPIIEIYTYNTDLKNKLTSYEAKYPELCRQIDDDEQDAKPLKFVSDGLALS